MKARKLYLAVSLVLILALLIPAMVLVEQLGTGSSALAQGTTLEQHDCPWQQHSIQRPTAPPPAGRSDRAGNRLRCTA